MNKNILIILGFVLAGLAGYFLSNRIVAGSIVRCHERCEESANLDSIGRVYSECIEQATEKYNEALLVCPCNPPLPDSNGHPNVELCNNCKDIAKAKYNEAKVICRRNYMNALGEYRKCKSNCNKGNAISGGNPNDLSQ